MGRAPLIAGGWLVYAGFSFALALDHDQVWALWVLALGPEAAFGFSALCALAATALLTIRVGRRPGLPP